MAYVVAALVAAAILWYELVWVQRYWYTISSSLYWAARVAIEAAAGIALLAGLRRAPASALSVNAIILAALAGACAPRIARFPALVKTHNLNLFNLVYERLNGPLESNIDEHSTQAQRDYCKEHVRPAVTAGKLTVPEVTAAFREHLMGRHKMTDAELEKGLAFIAKIEADASSDADKVVTLVLRAWQIGAYVSMKSLLNQLPRRRYGRDKAVADLRKFFRREDVVEGATGPVLEPIATDEGRGSGDNQAPRSG